jgi:polyisoprenoid-binding protein YceI
MLTRRALLLTVCCWVTAGCVPRPPPESVPPEPSTVPAIVAPPGAERFEVDPDRSAVTIEVRRAGALARFGHNHVIVSSVESGVAWLGPDLAASGFEVRVPVRALVVDDPAARAMAGPDFPGAVPEESRQGTYANMLREDVLDAARHPEIVVSAAGLAGTWERPALTARVTLRGVTQEVAVPLTLRREPTTLLASGRLHIRQTDFGITPFSVGGGAVQVADDVEVRFEIVASRP